MNTKEYNNIEEMNTSHNNTLNEINNLISDSHRSYYDRYEEDVLADMKKNADNLRNGTATEDIEDNSPTWDFDGDEYGYSSYTTQARIINEELQYSSDDSFQIGNNVKGGI